MRKETYESEGGSRRVVPREGVVSEAFYKDRGSSLAMHRTHLTTEGTSTLLCNIHLNTFKPENNARTALFKMYMKSLLLKVFYVSITRLVQPDTRLSTP